MIKKLMSGLVVGSAAVLSMSMSAQAATTYATEVTLYDYDAQGGAAPAADRQNTANALGMENGTFLSLGIGGYAIFGFGEAFADPAQVWEVTFNCSPQPDGTCNLGSTNYAESVDVYVGFAPLSSLDDIMNGVDGWQMVGSVQNGDAFNGSDPITFAGVFQYLALVDTSPSGGASTDGFDLDAVSVSSVPLPAPLLLLLSGLLGLGYLGRARSKAA